MIKTAGGGNKPIRPRYVRSTDYDREHFFCKVCGKEVDFVNKECPRCGQKLWEELKK